VTAREAAAAPPALAPPPGHPRFPLFDGLRAIAALSIVVTHTANQSGFNQQSRFGPLTARLDVGVTVFFVISGFLLYRPFVASRLEGRPRPAVWRYARRRALRILPAYWVALTVLGGIGWLHGVLGDHWWVHYGLVQNLHTSWILTGLGVAWSLCIEASFYLVLPLYALAAERWLHGRSHGRQMRAELIVLPALGAASLVARAIVFDQDPGAAFSFTLPGTFLWFAVGMSLAVLSAGLHPRTDDELPAPLRWVAKAPWLAWVAAAAVLVFTAWGAGLPSGATWTAVQWGEQHLLYATFALLLVVPAVFGQRGVVARVLGNPVAAWLGLVSYGIFLYHVPLVSRLLDVGSHGGFVVYTAAVAAVATGCAAASYYIVERPLLKLKETRRA